MEKNVPLGSSVKLPSIEGLTSTCEKELYVLMQEIDKAFERKHKDLLDEVAKLKASNDSKHTECEKLRSLLEAEIRANRQQSDSIRHMQEETEKLKNKNSSLNDTLQRNLRAINEQDNQALTLKDKLLLEQQENFLLKERVAQLEKQLSCSEDNYQKCLNLLLSGDVKISNGKKNENKNWPMDFKDAFASEEVGRYDVEEREHCRSVMSEIKHNIQEMEKYCTISSQTRSHNNLEH